MDLIRNTEKTATRYGIVMERETVRFIDLAVVFGRDFTTDPHFPFAGKILERQDLSGSNKIDDLAKTTIHHRAHRAHREKTIIFQSVNSVLSVVYKAFCGFIKIERLYARFNDLDPDQVPGIP